MGAMKFKKKSPIMQGKRLKTIFPNSDFTILEHGKGIRWEGEIQPTPICQIYRISIVFWFDKHPTTKVISPQLLIREGEKLPHVYSQIKKQLCLYYPIDKEWHSSLWIAETIVPWASEWLYHYENWTVTGNWQGGGIDHESPEKPATLEEKKNTIPKLKFSNSVYQKLKKLP